MNAGRMYTTTSAATVVASGNCCDNEQADKMVPYCSDGWHKEVNCGRTKSYYVFKSYRAAYAINAVFCLAACNAFFSQASGTQLAVSSLSIQHSR